MKPRSILWSGATALAAVFALATPAVAATSTQIGASGQTYASSTVTCGTDPATNQLAPIVEVGLLKPTQRTSATVALNAAYVTTLSAARPSTNIVLADGTTNTVVITLSRKTADTYRFAVPVGMCSLPDTSGNTFSADGTLEYGASGRSYATVTPGCALNPATGQPQPYVNVFDNGTYVLNVSVNGVPLTQLSATRPHTPVFLGSGLNRISVAYGSLSTDWFVRDGGTGTCLLP